MRDGAKRPAALAAATAAFACCIATALATSAEPAVQGPGEAREGPPTEAQVERWEDEFLAENAGQGAVARPAPTTKRGARTLFPRTAC